MLVLKFLSWQLEKSDPIQWAVKKRPSPSTADFKVPKRVTRDLAAKNQGAATQKMSPASWPPDPMEHNWCEEEPPLDDMAIPSLYFEYCSSDSEDGEGNEAAK